MFSLWFARHEEFEPKRRSFLDDHLLKRSDEPFDFTWLVCVPPFVRTFLHVHIQLAVTLLLLFRGNFEVSKQVKTSCQNPVTLFVVKYVVLTTVELQQQDLEGWEHSPNEHEIRTETREISSGNVSSKQRPLNLSHLWMILFTKNKCRRKANWIVAIPADKLQIYTFSLLSSQRLTIFECTNAFGNKYSP